MESVLMVMTTAAGLIFSISCAVLIEELLIGGFFKRFAGVRVSEPKQKHL